MNGSQNSLPVWMSVSLAFGVVAVAAILQRGQEPDRARAGAQSALADLHRAAGQGEHELRVLALLSETRQSNPELRLRQAAAMLKAGDLVSAERAYRSLLQSNGRNPIAQYNLAQVLLRKGEVAEARTLLRGVCELYADDIPWLVERAKVCLRLLAVRASAP